MSYSRGEIYAFQDFETGNLEINFSKDLSYEHNRKSRCGGHFLNKEQAIILLDVCHQYLKDVEDYNEHRES